MREKQTNPLVVLAGSIVFGLVAVFLSISYLNNKEDELRRSIKGPKLEKVEVVVAKEDLPRGAKVGYHNMVTRLVPYDFIHPSAITLNNFEQFDGKILIENLPAGKPLLSSFIAKSFPKDFSDTIPLKRRAMTIQVDEINSIAGLIRPGNFIDLFSLVPAKLLQQNSSEDSKIKADVVIPVLQNVEVLATANRPAKVHEEDLMLLAAGQTNQIKKFSTITVNVTPKEAALLASVQDKGDLIALLRNRLDKTGATFSEVKITDILKNAQQMAKENQLRNERDGLSSAQVAQAGDILLEDGSILKKGDYKIDKNGNIVTKDGKVISKHSVTHLQAGDIVTADGKVLKDPNLIVKDGLIMTKDGVVLSGRGLTVNENGELVDKNGRIIDTNGLHITADGSLVTQDGVVLATAGDAASTAGIIVAKDGDILLADGSILSKKDYAVAQEGDLLLVDGTILKKGQYKVDENGNIVTQDGRVINKADVTTLSAGQIVTKSGQVLDQNEVTNLAAGQILTKDGVLIKGDGLSVAKDGDFLLADGTILKEGDYSFDENGNIVTKDGKVIDKSQFTQLVAGQIITKEGQILNPDDVLVLEDGTVVTRNGTVIKGVSADLTTLKGALSRNTQSSNIEFLSGGNSQDGVSNVGILPVLEK